MEREKNPFVANEFVRLCHKTDIRLPRKFLQLLFMCHFSQAWRRNGTIAMCVPALQLETLWPFHFSIYVSRFLISY